MRILVVEDDSFITSIFSMFIKTMGHQLIGQCKSGIEAIEACRRQVPDVVLMDINIEGDLNGIVTCQMLYDEFDVPVIYVSGETDNHVIQHAVTTNSYGYLVKPITKQELGISLDLAFYKHKIDVANRVCHVIESDQLAEVQSAIVVVSRGNIRYINNYALALFNAEDMEEMMVKPFIEYIGSNIKDEVLEVINQSFINSRWVKTIRGNLLDVNGESFWAEIVITEVSFGGTRVLQFTINDRSRDIEPITYVNVMKKALMNYPRLCLLLSQDLDIFSYNKVYINKTIDEQLQIANFLRNANLNLLFQGNDEIKLELKTSYNSSWIKIFAARDVSGMPLEFVVIEVDKD